jgi:hypothetical protein
VGGERKDEGDLTSQIRREHERSGMSTVVSRTIVVYPDLSDVANRYIWDSFIGDKPLDSLSTLRTCRRTSEMDFFLMVSARSVLRNGSTRAKTLRIGCRKRRPCLLEISPRTAIEPSNRVNAGSVERSLWFLQHSGYRHLARSKTVYEGPQRQGG